MSVKGCYYFENGFRKVIPYFNEYITHPKERWLNKKLIDVFVQELGFSHKKIHDDIDKNLIYIKKHCNNKNNTVVIKGLKDLESQKIEKHDLIINTKHIHETPTYIFKFDGINNFKSQNKTLFEIIYENDEILVINKPCGIAVHPSATTKYNTLLEILKYELNLENLWLCHRLDKCVSGILVFGKTKNQASFLHKLLLDEKRLIKKIYIAKVQGEFPNKRFMINCPVFSINSNHGFFIPQSITSLSAKSCTIFKKISYDERTNLSIVECEPLSGKYHQIRIHLRNINYPIIDDFLYNPQKSDLFFDTNYKINELEKKIYEKIYDKYPEFKTKLDPDDEIYDQKNINITEFLLLDCINFKSNIKKIIDEKKKKVSFLRSQFKDYCTICNDKIKSIDPLKVNMKICLHSHKFFFESKNDSFHFESELPSWSIVKKKD